MRTMRWTGSVVGAVVCALLVAGCGACGNCTGGGGSVTAVTVTVSPASITTGQTAQAKVEVSGTGSFNGDVTWSVSPSSIGTISSTGLFTAATTGMATITATSVEDPTKSGSATVTVGAAAPTITSVTVTLNPSTITTAQTTQATATVAGTGSYSSGVTWSVSGTAGGTVSSAGVFTPAGTGTATITATSTEDTTKSGSAQVTVTAPPPTITSVSVTMSATSITTAQTSQGTATVAGTGAYSSGVTWSVSPSTIGSISGMGLFTPAMAGTATITATSTEDTTKSGSAQVTVNPVAAITSVTVSVAPSSINTSQTAQATATVQGVGAYSSTVTWTVGPSGIGAISNTGLFTPASAGTATITATSTEDFTKYGSAQVTVTAAAPTITGVTVTPSTATIGTTQQFTANVSGTGAYNHSVTWAVSGPSGWTGSIGSIGSSGLYMTPYPAPATVTVTATSVGDTSVSGSATVSLQPPATTAGPALTVDATDPLHAINPLIYGMNGYAMPNADATQGNIPVVRWGGDDTSRYNYQTNVSNSASDWYFENGTGAGSMPGGGNFTDFVSTVHSLGAEPLGTVPVLGWVSNSNSSACSFPVSTYPGQQQIDPYSGRCGNGMYPNGTHGCTNSSGCNIPGGAAEQALTSIAEPPPANSAATMPTASAATTAWAQGTWAGGWVNSLVTSATYGPASGGKGVNIWDLDNEPAWWDAVHRDVHPSPSTYDEVTYGGISTALAVKTIDPSAQVSGPVIDYWWNYFYSKQDIENGWSNGPCYQPWDHPTDRQAHGGVPMIEYYLQQFATAQTTYGMRLLDYVDIHAYDAATYNGASVGFATAGDTGEQEARINSTRALWDPTYTDPNLPQPNYSTDANYTTSCNLPLQAPQLIPMLRKWVARDYPGTRTAIDEYNWGGLESINGALTQADVLGIFGQYGLDLGTLWGAPTTSQVPGLMAFEIYRNYDGHDSTFGDTALASCSGTAAASCDTTGTNALQQNQLAVYGALRSSDNAVTVVVINKSYGALTSTLSLEGVTASGQASVYQYSNANLNAIVAEASVAVTAPSGGSTASTIAYTFPAQSVTLLVVPQ
jgi:uncharacterized protein YjdB